MNLVATGPRTASSPGLLVAPPCTVVLFGAGGDLARRLLVPSLYNLVCAGLLPEGFRLLGLDVADTDEEGWKRMLRESIDGFTRDPDAEFHPERIDEEAWSFLMHRASLRRADFTDPSAFEALHEGLGDGSALFYLAVPARFFATIAERLGRAGLLDEAERTFRRLVIEKPFGSDLASARALNRRLLAVAREAQLYRIDHFMGKEPVQSILAMRFGNRLFEPLLSAEHVERVEITAAETLGVEGRARFYEATGALRDMVPNHLFQLLCMIAMDPPSSLEAEAVRLEKTRLLRAVRPLAREDVVFGQYGAGHANGRDLPAYRDEPGVAPESVTETFAALTLRVDNWRWAGTPFVLRTGKRMAARRTEIVLRFRAPPCALFETVPRAEDTSDRIVIGIDPVEGVEIGFDVKRPGPEMALAPIVSRFRFDEAFAERPNVGYEVLLYDAMTGDATLFQHADTIEAAWAVVDPVLGGERPPIEPYAAGTDGPAGSPSDHVGAPQAS